MEYTIKKLANLAGVSTRTLRYYDEIHLLKPVRINSSGYRIYGQKEIDRLQQMMFYRELGMELNTIQKIINADDYNEIAALKTHRMKLINENLRLILLINNIEKTIKMKEGNVNMNDDEKFVGFKNNLIEENEKKYGKEIREKYRNEAINMSNELLNNMTKEQYEFIEKLNNDLFTTLGNALKTKDPASEEAQKAAKMHKEWLTFYWSNYSKEAHASIARLYVDDERFKAYYDKLTPGTAEFLRDAILIYLKKND